MFEELKRLKTKIEDGKAELITARRKGIYNDEYLTERAQGLIKTVKTERNEFYTSKSREVEKQMQQIAKEHQKPLTDAEVSRQLLNLKKAENKIRFMTDQELTKTAREYIDEDVGDYDELNIIGKELQNRGVKAEAAGMPPVAKNLAAELKSTMAKRNIQEPHKNDLAYREASREAEAIKVVSGPRHDDYFYPGYGTPEQETVQISSAFHEFGIGTQADFSRDVIFERFKRKQDLSTL